MAQQIKDGNNKSLNPDVQVVDLSELAKSADFPTDGTSLPIVTTSGDVVVVSLDAIKTALKTNAQNEIIEQLANASTILNDDGSITLVINGESHEAGFYTKFLDKEYTSTSYLDVTFRTQNVVKIDGVSYLSKVDGNVGNALPSDGDTENEWWSLYNAEATGVVDNLDSTNAKAALSANQGKVLNDRINEIEGKGINFEVTDEDAEAWED